MRIHLEIFSYCMIHTRQLNCESNNKRQFLRVGIMSSEADGVTVPHG
jgi:hypothetical protein